MRMNFRSSLYFSFFGGAVLDLLDPPPKGIIPPRSSSTNTQDPQERSLLEKIATICVYCGCGCGLVLHVEDGRVVGASPSPAHPVSRGRLCVKGWLAADFVHHPDRLKTPLVRRGERMARVSWDEALSLSARRLREIREESGPDSLAILTSAKGTNEENYLLAKLARAALGTNNVDHVARLCHAPSVAGLGIALGSGAMTNPIRSLLSSDAILVTGSNTTEQHPLVAATILEAQARGATLIVADPRRTQMAELADIHLAPRLGTDVAWTNGMLNLIIGRGLIDEDFINERTEGFSALKELALRYTPAAVERITGIPPGDLEKAAAAFGEAPRAGVVYAMGTTQHSSGTDNVLALANLVLATGNVGRDGTGIYPLRGHQNVQGACDMGALPIFYSGYQKVEDPAARRKMEAAWGTDLPATPGLTAVEMMEAAEEGRIRGMIISGENPMISYPDRGQVIRALRSLDFLAVADIFPTETTALADVVLPVASFAEKDGTFTSTERRIQRVRRAVTPPGEARPEVEVAAELLRRFSVTADYASPEEVMGEISSVTPSYGGVSSRRLGISGLSWPCPSPDHPGTEILHQGSFPIGRARFYVVEQQHLPEDLDYPLFLTTGRSLFHFHTGTMTRRTHLLDRERPKATVDINPADAAALGVRSGTMVVVESATGSLEIEARLTAEVPMGTVYIPFHFAEAPANQLTTRTLDPTSKIPGLKRTPVRIRRADG
jgi:formate dehydrogenase major subunit/formate dehydrogenase alpha subunit